jgi:hypothetical protein
MIGILLTALVLIGLATPASADPATLLITSLGLSATGWAAFGIRVAVGIAFSALSNALVSGAANAGGAPKGITLRSITAGEQVPQSFILGRYVTAGNLAAPEMSHGTGGDTRYLTRVIDLSDVQVDSLEGLIINGVRCDLATGSPSTLTMTQGDGTTSAIHPDYGPTVNKGDFIGFAWCRFRDGSQTTVDPMLSAKYGSYPQRPWQSGMVGRGVAQAIMTFLWRDSPQVWQGRPDVRFIVKGIRLYDPRKDSTAGGSGAHRYGTVSTHEWSENPVVMIYNLLRGIQILGGHIYGGGFTAADLPYATWAAAMNACDVMIGDRKTYVAGLEVFMGGSDAGGQSPADVIEELLKACSGQIADVGGTLVIRVGGPGLPVKFITDDDVLVTQGQELDPFPGAQDSYNIVHATWMSPGNLWTPKEATPRRDDTAISADGQELPADIALPAVTVAGQVQQLMVGWLKDAQRHRRQTITLPPEGILLKPLDVIDWTSPRNGYAGKDFEIGQVAIDPMTLCTTLALREVDPDDYDWAAGDDIAVTAPSVEPVVPAPVTVPGFTATATTIKDATGADRLPAIRLGWTLPLPGVSTIRFQIRVSGSNTVAVEGSTANVDVGYHVVSAGIVANVQYQARARLVGPKTTEWTAWVTVTAPDVGITGADFQGSIEEVFRNAGLAPVEIVTALPTTGNFEGRTVYLTTDNKLYRWTGTAWTAAVETVDLVGQIVAEQVASGAITTAKFATGLAPVEIVTTLPTTGNFAGRTVYLTTDGKLYRHTGSPTGSAGFTATVPAVDVTGQLTDAQIAAVAAAKLTGQITAPQIASAAVTADKIAAQAVTTAKFASGIAPVEIVAALPTTGNFEGRTVYLTTDDRLYRHTGSPTGSAGFTAAVPAADVTGQLTNAQIADVAAAKLTGQITAPQIADGAVTDAKIAAGAVTTAKFATGIAPVEIVATLPTTGNFEGRTVYLTTDDRLYRHTGSPTGSAGFTAAVPAADVTGQLTNAQIADVAAAKLTGQITTTQITDSAVTTAKVNAGAVTTAKLAAGAVTADTIAANAVTTVKINAGAVTANEIASGAVTADKVAANAITAGKIAAGAVSATEIAAGAVIASRIAVADFTNLVPDSEVADAGVWPAGSGGEFALVNPSTSGFISRGHIRRPSGFATTGDRASGSQTRISIKAGQEYWWQYQVFRVGGTTMRSVAQIIWHDAAGTQITAPVLGSYTANTTAGIQTRNGVITPPANAVSGTWRWLVRGEDTDSEVQFASPELRIRNGGELIVDGAISANKIAASAVTADKIAASAIDATKIAAGSITSVELASSSVTTVKLAAGAVTADTIATNAVTTAKINAGAVTANEIATNAVTSAKIAADAITAGKIAAGVVSATEIAAGAVTASKLAVTDSTNLVPDSQIQEAAAWGNAANFQVIPTTSASPPPSKGELRYIGPYNVGTALSDSRDFDVVAGREYWFQYVLGRINGTTYRAYAALRFSDKNGSFLSSSTLGSAGTDRTGLTTVSGTVTVPANAVRASFRFLVNTDFTDSNVRCWAPTIRVMNGGELIVDGAISADKIAASAVTADKIAASAIDATKIAAGSITAVALASGAVTTAKLAAGAVTADTIATNAVTTAKINAGAVTATEIAAGAVTATKIAADTITAGQIAAGAVAASEIAAGAVNADKLAASAVTADKIAANAITAGKIAADAVTADKVAANAITTGKIAANAITAGLIAAGAVSADKIAASAITAAKIQAGTLTQSLFSSGQLNTALYPARIQFITASNSAWSPSLSGLFQVWVFGAGGGGGAAGSSSTECNASGGGAGGLAIGFVADGSTGQTYAIVVGAGGAGGNPGNADGQAAGGAGGNSRFSGNGVDFRGNGGAAGSASRATTALLAGGTGGTASGGSYNYTGGAGGDVDLTSGGHRALASGGGAPQPALGGAINAPDQVSGGVSTLGGLLLGGGGASVPGSFSGLEVTGFPMRGYDTFAGGQGRAESPNSASGNVIGGAGATGCGGGGGAARRVLPNGNWARGGAGGDGLVVIIYYRVGNFV